jgi:hypothetical protein
MDCCCATLASASAGNRVAVPAAGGSAEYRKAAPARGSAAPDNGVPAASDGASRASEAVPLPAAAGGEDASGSASVSDEFAASASASRREGKHVTGPPAVAACVEGGVPMCPRHDAAPHRHLNEPPQ